jgi:hypothetical protein
LEWDNRTFLGIYFANVDSGLGGIGPLLPLDKISAGGGGGAKARPFKAKSRARFLNKAFSR